MAYKLLTALVLLSTLLSTGCAQEKSKKKKRDAPILNDDERGQLRTFNASTVSCPSNDCPPSVGKLTYMNLVSEDYPVGVCSVTLISEKLILTNAHCLPEDITVGDKCDRHIKIQFPSTANHSFVETKCDEVLEIYPADEFGMLGFDTALISIQSRVSRRPSRLNVSHDFVANSYAYSYSMNPTYDYDLGSNVSGEIVKKEYRVVVRNLRNPNNDLETPSIVSLKPVDDLEENKVISGNSGSGLFNSRGEIIGVIHSGIITDAIESNFTAYGINYEWSTDFSMGMGTNISRLFNSRGDFISPKSICVNTMTASSFDVEAYLKETMPEKLKNNSLRDIHYAVNGDFTIDFNKNYEYLRDNGRVELPSWYDSDERLDYLLEYSALFINTDRQDPDNLNFSNFVEKL